MQVAFELSGEHPALARAEAEAVLATLGGTVESAFGRVVVGQCETPLDALARRAALAWRVIEVAGTAPVDDEAVVALARRVRLAQGSFAVRCSRLVEGLSPDLAQRIERSLGAALAEQAPVDLSDPDQVVRVLLDERAVVGLERGVVDRSSYEARHPENRPHFSPISLHPRLARTLVNLTRVRPGQRVWDPFMGTGGLVLEAALVGADAIGSDLDPAMVEGTERTLAAFGQSAQLLEGDVAVVAEDLGTVDAVVTDPPYGRASKTHREEVQTLYKRFFQAADRVLSPGGRLVCVLPRPEDAGLAPDGLSLEGQFAWYVHGTLTRHVLVYVKAGST